jgi:PAS domain S-box-containing protein
MFYDLCLIIKKVYPEIIIIMKIKNSIYGKWLLFLSIIVASIGMLFYLSYKDIKNLALIEFNKQQMLLAEQAVSGIEEQFNSLNRDLEFISGFEDVGLMNENGKRLLTGLLEKNRGFLSSVGRIDSKGRILWLNPANRALIGTDISYQKHVKYILDTHQPSISDVFITVQGFRSIAYHYPVFFRGQYRGSIGILINFDYISKKYIENIRIGNAGYAWIISGEGIELYCPVPGHKGVSVFETSKDFPDVINMAKRMMAGEKGTTTYRYNIVKDEYTKVLVKHAAFAPLKIVNTKWSIVVATPEDYILSSVKGFRNKSLMILLLVIVISILFYYFLFRVWIYVNEVKNRVRIESAIRENEENLRITLNSIGDAVISTDENGNVKRMNPAAESITGWSAKDAAGKPLSEVFSVVDSVTGVKSEGQFIKIVKAGSESGMSESATLFDKNGIEKKISRTATPILNAAGNVVGAVVVFRDISEKIRIEEQLRQSQKMDLIGRLTGGVAHDFNNMLAGILSASEVLEMKFINDDKSIKFISFIKDTALKASGLTQKLLNFSRKGVRVSENIDVHNSISLAVDILRHSINPNIKIIKEFTAEKSIVSGDPSQMQSMILNLVINARDAMPEGGEVTIRTVNLIMNESHCVKTGFGIDPGLYVKISVKDTGKGIDDELKSKIFEPFFTTKSAGDGTGLGLSIVYGNVKDHGGAIEVADGDGCGTVFNIYLPVLENIIWKKEKVETIIPGKGKILVVEDEFILRSITESILADLGYKVIVAENGKVALDIFRKDYRGIDVILLDVIMPVMGGIEALEEFIKIDPSVVAYLISGNIENLNPEIVVNCGASGILQKPVTIPELSRAVSEGIIKKAKK